MAIENFIAGDSVTFTQLYRDYSSTDYNSVLYLNGPSTLQVSGSISSNVTASFDYNITPNASQYLKSGLYSKTCFVLSKKSLKNQFVGIDFSGFSFGVRKAWPKSIK